jgi:hypothetical protein
MQTCMAVEVVVGRTCILAFYSDDLGVPLEDDKIRGRGWLLVNRLSMDCDPLWQIGSLGICTSHVLRRAFCMITLALAQLTTTS